MKLRKTLEEVSEYSVLTVNGSNCTFTDYDIFEIISEYQNIAPGKNRDSKRDGRPLTMKNIFF